MYIAARPRNLATESLCISELSLLLWFPGRKNKAPANSKSLTRYRWKRARYYAFRRETIVFSSRCSWICHGSLFFKRHLIVYWMHNSLKPCILQEKWKLVAFCFDLKKEEEAMNARAYLTVVSEIISIYCETKTPIEIFISKEINKSSSKVI